MSVTINGVTYTAGYQSEEMLDEFTIFDDLKTDIGSKLPSDISYFDHRKLDEIFRELDRRKALPEDYAYVLYKIIINIGNAARQPSSLEKCYNQRVRYKRTISYYYGKYKSKLAPAGKLKIRHAIESQFKHFEINPIKMALTGLSINGNTAAGAIISLIKNPTANQIAGGLVNTFTGWLAVKYYDLLEAVRVYKRAMNAEYDIDDVKSFHIRAALRDEAGYFYEVARAILDDILKVYDQL